MNETFTQNPLEKLRSEIEDWEGNEVAAFLNKQAERKEQFFTTGDFPVQRVYTAADIAETPLEDVGLPGRYPFTRGPYPTMYRSRVWTMRQIAGFGTGEDTNEALQIPDLARPDGSVDRLRYAYAHGLRLRPPDERGRGGPRGRGRGYARRHGGAV